ncbi:hypothetical protein [Nonomuraea sp. 10N515B]|uniref:hypothetical protein n=1 Tax=Nonomuraea sp. 10N515B TaxID=3457422 RepID=UPI003FCD6B5D
MHFLQDPEAELIAPTLYTTEEAAARLGPQFKPSTLRRLAAARKVDVALIGRKYWWTDDQLAQVVEVSTRPAAKKTGSRPSRSHSTSTSVSDHRTSVELLRPDPGGRYGKRAS